MNDISPTSFTLGLYSLQTNIHDSVNTLFYVRFKETTVYRKVTLAQLKVTLAQ